jgi:natural product precursor
MKTKKLNKKLTLNKATVADLDKAEMGNVVGGVLTTAIRILCTGECPS